MFSKIASFAQKYRIFIIVFWLAAAISLFFAAPTFSDVAVTDESQFLPQDTQSASAAKLLKEKFPGIAQNAASSGIIVIYNSEGLTSQNMLEAKAMRDWLASDSAPEVIEGVTSIFDSDLLRQVLLSSDQTTMMMQVSFSVSSLSDTAKTGVNRIREYLTENHPDIDVYFTGETGLLQDLFESVQQTISKTTIVTIILVLIVLLIIYRSPIAALLPLVAIGCSFLASMGILGFLGQAGMKFFTLAEAYLVVIIFGIGTDYCLFIVSRFREELKNHESKEALIYSMKHIGPVIAASALTVIVAFLCLGLSRFGMNKTSGYAMAIGIGITLLAGLTLVPALISLFGKYLFWPAWAHRPIRVSSFSWAKIGDWVVKHPLLVALPMIVVLLLPYVAFSNFVQTNDIVSQMPGDTQSVKGYQLISKHFPAGELSPAYMLVESSSGIITGEESLRSIESLAQSLQNVSGVSRVDYFSAPSGQLTALAMQIRGLGDGLGKGTIGDLSVLQSSGQQLQGLVLQYPGIVQSQNFQQIEANITEVSTLAGQISTTGQANLPSLLMQLQKIIYDMADKLDALAGEFNLTGNNPFTVSLLNTYFSTDETTARINVVLNSSPYAAETVDTITGLREATGNDISTSSLKGSTYYIGGESATRADIMLTSESDFGLVFGCAIAGILIVIIILLRSLVAPLYMIATVLLNYGATLGITTWFFTNIMKQSGMIYMIPIFIFIILVALGADYNIFLVSRIREEVHQRPIKEAVSRAIANTGGVITSCGIILACTFATLMVSPLQMVAQLGVAIVIGVIIDTFLVRAFLVPSIASLLGRWNWWPSRRG
jgi:putative drug exporter of the RND superfamily